MSFVVCYVKPVKYLNPIYRMTDNNMNRYGKHSEYQDFEETVHVYKNDGNAPLLQLLENSCKHVLDVGCGAGDNAGLLKSYSPEKKVYGITKSEAEKKIAQRYMERVWVFDIESELPTDLENQKFDTLLFSHVLEHLHDPAAVLARFSHLLNPGGIVLIAVPNILSWRQRIQFLLGRFEYKATGVLDETHLRFFTFFTADQYLLNKSPDLEIQFKGVTGSIPLWWLRRYVFPKTWSKVVDEWSCRHWPNLFGGQILIKAKKK